MTGEAAFKTQEEVSLDSYSPIHLNLDRSMTIQEGLINKRWFESCNNLGLLKDFSWSNDNLRQMLEDQDIRTFKHVLDNLKRHYGLYQAHNKDGANMEDLLFRRRFQDSCAKVIILSTLYDNLNYLGFTSDETALAKRKDFLFFQVRTNLLNFTASYENWGQNNILEFMHRTMSNANDLIDLINRKVRNRT